MSKSREDKKIIYVIVFVLVILFIILSIFIKILFKDKKVSDNIKAVEQQQQVNDNNDRNEELIAELKKVSEGERIKIYLSQYFKSIEKKDYETAYNLLNDKFKEKYFQTLDKYISFIKSKKYPELFTISYDEINMQGDYYVVKVTIGDMLKRDSDIVIEENLVVKENDYNDFSLSFKFIKGE